MFNKSFLALALAAMAAPAVSAPPAGTVRPAPSVAPSAVPTYSLQALRELARAGHPSLEAVRAHVEAGRAQVVGAGAYPNPEVEFLAGRTQARVPGAASGSAQSVTVLQRIDNPWQREARIDAASFGLDARQAERRAFENDLLARL
ncbi:MAG: TolC family protein, partial [Zoogloea sp.]|nr:TolC family protein [Zoogloea sp.]